MPTELFKIPPDSMSTGMVIPVSKETFFNTKWKGRKPPLCPYDMLFHPPDYDPKSARADRTDPGIIRQNIWDQELPKRISSTNHFMYGRPAWPILDRPDKQFVNMKVTIQNPHMRINDVLEWAQLIYEGKSICVQ